MADLGSYVKSVKDFPDPGDDYKEFSSLLSDKCAFDMAMEGFIGMFDREIFDAVVCTESYGGMFGTAVAMALKKPVITVRYKGGFPGETVFEDAGDKVLEMPADKVKRGMKVVIMCDVLATGRSTAAMIRMVERMGGKVVRIGYIAELTSFGARKSKILKGYPFEALLEY
ncbi:MAG: adenine phosphoribosyltransferase [Candidatus Methanomethylophilaceae archaeon]|nr:adenine phosphoribosyltransferase [Candidatus Methanomethylophilaceae archaeon]